VIVAVSTNPAIDRIALAEGAAAGGLVRARELLVTAGGKAAHVAGVAAALGADARLVAPVGGELFGDLLDVPATLVPVAAPTRGTYTVVDPAAGDVLEVHEPSPALSAAECDALVAAAEGAAAGAAVVVIAGSLSAGAPADLHARLLRAGGAAFTVLDTSSPAALEAGLAARPDLVKPNVSEAAALLGAAGDDAAALALALRDRGAGSVWLSAGERGSVLATGDGAWHLAGPHPEAVVSAVGCGDALVGGLAAGLARGLSLLDAAALGTAAATDKLRHLHSGRVDAEAVARLVPAVTRRRIAALP
jgi:1-phosphofructokinase family hexose kinase